MDKKRYVLNNTYCKDEVAGEVVLNPVASSVHKLNDKMFVLNPTGAFILDRMEEGKSVGEIADDLVSEYEVDRETAIADVARFALTMVERGFFTEKNDEGDGRC